MELYKIGFFLYTLYFYLCSHMFNKLLQLFPISQQQNRVEDWLFHTVRT